MTRDRWMLLIGMLAGLGAALAGALLVQEPPQAAAARPPIVL